MSEPIPKYSRKATEKIWNVLQEIEENSQLVHKTGRIRLPFVPPGFVGTVFGAETFIANRQDIVHMLEAVKAIRELEHSDGIRGSWFFKKGLNYQKIFNKYKKMYEAGARQVNKVKEYQEPSADEIVYRIEYSDKNRQILLNGMLLAKPDFEGDNERFFTYAYSNPNRRIPNKELRSAGITKSTQKILEQLGFIGDVRAVFFDVSKSGVRFRNPIYKKDLQELGVSRLKLDK